MSNQGEGLPRPFSVSVKIADTQAEIAACMALRWDVFVLEQDVPEADELDGQDQSCTHVIAEDSISTIGAARFQITNDCVKIQRVCVPKAMRGYGIGVALIQFICKDSKAKRAMLSAQVDALPFYEKLGFHTQGPTYLDAGILHQDMVQDLYSIS